MARVNIDILVISELKWIGMGKFNSDDHYVYYCGQESLRRNGIALRLNKRLWNAVLGCNLKNNSMIWFTSKANYSIYSNPSLCPDHWFQRSWGWTVLWRPTRPSRTNTKKDVSSFHHRGWTAKVGSHEIPGVPSKFGFGVQNEVGQRLTEFCQKNTLL